MHESTEEILRLRMNGRVRIVVNSAGTIDKLIAPRVAVVGRGVLSVACTLGTSEDARRGAGLW